MNTGITKRGYVSRKEGQKKMHVKDMTNAEIYMINTYLLTSAVNAKPSLSYHLSQKIVSGEISFNEAQLVETLANPMNLVELNVQEEGIGVLYRSDKDYEVMLDGKLQLANLCVVINPDTLYIVTAYYNSVIDNHDTIIPDRYTTFDIKEVLYG